MKTRITAVCLLLVLARFWSANAEITKLPNERRNALQDVSRFREAHAVTNLPPQVLALCADGNGRLAGPGQAWQATDVITNDKLPDKRLIWAATGGEYWVVHYERGGRGHSYHAVVVQLRRGDAKPSFVWRGVGERLKDYQAFLAAVRSNKLDDTLDYAH
jgi:hypothetical protein